MYVFLLTVSFMCNEQVPAVASQQGCDGVWMAALPAEDRKIATSVRGYFASEAGCLAGASTEMRKEAAVSEHLAKSGAVDALRNPHIVCQKVKVQP
jgi:hypothetical protein